MIEFDRYKRILNEDFPVYLKARDRKPVIRQAMEIYRLMRMYRYLPYQYLKHGLYRRGFDKEIYRYIPPELLHLTRNNLNARGDKEALHDKLQQEKMLCDGGVPTTKTLFRLQKSGIVDLEGNQVEFKDFIDRVGEMALPRGMIVKPRDGGSGAAVFKMDVEDGILIHEGEPLDFEAFRTLVYTTRHGEFWEEFVIQETIVQHPDLNRLNASSVNTVRIDTFIDDDGKVSFNAAALKIGVPGSVTDNGSSGGYMAGLDLATGHFTSGARRYAHDSGKNYDMRELYGIDPDTFAVPYWQDLLTTARKAAKCVAPFRSLGWDIAVAKDGPVVIEANHDYGVYVLQDLAGGYADQPLGRAFLEQFPNRDKVLAAL
jgi:hypothetical protein